MSFQYAYKCARIQTLIYPCYVWSTMRNITEMNKSIKTLISLLLTIMTACGSFAYFNVNVNAATIMPSAGEANLKVVDISQWNDSVTTNTDDIDFSLLKTQVDAVYIRSYGRNDTGTYVDWQAVNFARSAQEVNLKYGFYYYYIPKKDDLEDARQQAKTYYSFIKNFAYSCVPVLDVEYNPPALDENGEPNPEHLSKAQLAASVKAFADEFKSLSGFDLMIYSYPNFIKNNFDTSFPWNQYKLWIAHYDVPAPMYGISSTWMPESSWCWSRWDMWQYTSKGTLTSIPNSASGHLDLNTATDNIFLSTPIALSSLDSPSSKELNGGDITIRGWALSHSGVDRVDVYYDDFQWVGSTSDIYERPDVQETVNSNGRYNDGLHSGFSLTVEAGFFSNDKHTLRIAVINRNGTVNWFTYDFTYAQVEYQSHVQDVGWQGWVRDGDVSGTSGQSKRLEAMRFQLVDLAGGIEYRTHVQDIGWMPWVANGALSGTSGQSKRLEAIQIRLTGEASDNYDIYYRVHAENNGWLDWAKNGESSGTAGYSYRLEAIEVKLVPKNAAAPGATARAFVERIAPAPIDPSVQKVVYKTHVQDVGWQDYVTGGDVSGTSGQSKRLEAIQIKLTNIAGGIEYSTHVQDLGWMDYVANDALSGTSGQSKRLEAIRIRLTGAAAERLDVYYCVHAQNMGWLDWAKNGEAAGTAGYSYRLEAIKIVIVAKGSPAPGSTATPFRQAPA